MVLLAEDRLNKIYEDLKANYRPRFAELLFFDLTKDYYSITYLKGEHALNDSGLGREFALDKKPYAALEFCEIEQADVLCFYGVSFSKMENLGNGKILHFKKHSTKPIDMDKVKEELKAFQLLFSDPEAS